MLKGSINKILLIILIAAALGAIGGIVYVTTTSKSGFTEFYILDLEGKATDYPLELEVGDVGSVMVGIVNHEDEKVTYQLEVRINGTINEIESIALGDEEEWEELVSFVPGKVGDEQRVEFLLYKNREGEPYLELYLLINVKERK